MQKTITFPNLEVLDSLIGFLDTIKSKGVRNIEEHLLPKKNSLWFGLADELTLFEVDDEKEEERFIKR